MKELVKKNKILIIIFIVIILSVLGIIFFSMFNNNSIKKYSNNYYEIKYDKSWKLKKKENDYIMLKHGKDSKIKINIVELKSESRYSSIEELIDEINYNIEKQNPSYKLISKKDTTLSKNNYKGYKILYENDSLQNMTSVYKKGDKLIIINYESSNKYFDILLDSVENIIYNLNIKETEYSLKTNIKIDTKKISYSTDKDLDKIVKDSKQYEIANNNYYVKYSIPSSFELENINSNYNYFSLNDKESKDIKITLSIRNVNVYKLLDKEELTGVYSSYKTYKNDKDYSKFTESVSKIKENTDNFIYKNSYYYDKAIKYDLNAGVKNYSQKKENVELLYVLNKNHTLQISINSSDCSITKKLIESITIDEVKNYSSYITSIEKDGFLYGELKNYSDYKKDKMDIITIKLPNKYEEIQKYNNVYEEKTYGCGYDEEREIYDYKIEYKLSTIPIKSNIEIFNSSFSKAYGKYTYLTENNQISVNNKKFISYSGGYTQLGGIMYTNINRFKYYTNVKVLIYEIEENKYLIIKISGNGKNISNNILKEATNFVIEKKEV